jgi:hypothetical protein
MPEAFPHFAPSAPLRGLSSLAFGGADGIVGRMLGVVDARGPRPVRPREVGEGVRQRGVAPGAGVEVGGGKHGEGILEGVVGFRRKGLGEILAEEGPHPVDPELPRGGIVEGG